MLRIDKMASAFLVCIVSFSQIVVGQAENETKSATSSLPAVLVANIQASKLASSQLARKSLDQFLNANGAAAKLNKKALLSVDLVSVAMTAPTNFASQPKFQCKIALNDSGDPATLIKTLFGNVNIKSQKSGWSHFSSEEIPITGRFQSRQLEFGTPNDAGKIIQIPVSKALTEAFEKLGSSAAIRIAIDPQAILASEVASEGQKLMRDDALHSMFNWGQFAGASSMALYANQSLDDLSAITISVDLVENKQNTKKTVALNAVTMEGKSELVNAKISLAYDFLQSMLETNVNILKNQNVKRLDFWDPIQTGMKLTKSSEGFAIKLDLPSDIEDRWLAFNDSMETVRIDRSNNEIIENLANAAENFYYNTDQLPFHFDPDAEFDKDLSWRVKLLPYLGLEGVSERMELGQSWSEKGNRSAIQEGNDVFTLSGGHLVCAIDTAPFVKAPHLIDDEFTLMLIENPRSTMTPWTKPDDLTVDEAVELVKKIKPGKFLWAANFEGRVVKLPCLKGKKIPDEMIRNIFIPNDGKSTKKLSEILDAFNGPAPRSGRFNRIL